MLKPMKPQSGMPRNMFLWILVGLLVISGVVALVSAFGGEDDGTDDVNAIYTNAAATLAAQQGAAALFTPTATATAGTPTPTATFLPLPSPTLFTQPLLPTNTPGTGAGGASGAVGCNNSAYVADVTIPDNTVVTPGQAIKKTWKLQNTGSCAWTPTYKVSFQSGNAMGGVATPIGVTVAPGTSADISVDLKAPATAGDATGYWILTNDSGQNFGSNFYIQVKVGAASATGTTTVTPTATTGVPVPAAANNPTITLGCALENGVGPKKEHTGTLMWEDKSDNETGFNIYINNVFAGAVAANATSFNVPAGSFFDPGVSSTYSVEAFNNTGKAAQASVSASCPP